MYTTINPIVRGQARSYRSVVFCRSGPRPGVQGEVGLSPFDDGARSARIGYWIVPGQRGRGLATRAVRLLTASALNRYGLNTVIATVDPGNRASQVVLRRAGYEHDAVDPSRWTAT